MQVQNIQSTKQYNTSFTRFSVPKSSQRGFMATLRECCNTKDLIIIRREMIEQQIPRKKDIILKDLGFYFGQPMNGHLAGEIDGKIYTNSSPFRPSNWSISKFITRLAKKADNAKLKEENNKVSDEVYKCVNSVCTSEARSELNKAIRKEIKEALRLQKQGKVTAEEQNHYLYGEIYKLIQGEKYAG